MFAGSIVRHQNDVFTEDSMTAVHLVPKCQKTQACPAGSEGVCSRIDIPKAQAACCRHEE